MPNRVDGDEDPHEPANGSIPQQKCRVNVADPRQRHDGERDQDTEGKPPPGRDDRDEAGWRRRLDRHHTEREPGRGAGDGAACSSRGLLQQAAIIRRASNDSPTARCYSRMTATDFTLSDT